jgi:hypothetical protein
MNTPRPPSRVPLLIVRWVTRVLGSLMALLLLTFMIGEGYNPFTMQLRDALKTLLFPASVVVGLLLAWRWEGLGGVITLGGFGGFFLWERLASGHWPRGWAFHVFTAPAVLFLISWWLHRPSAVPPNNDGQQVRML